MSKFDTKVEFNEVMELLDLYDQEHSYMRIYLKEVRKYSSQHHLVSPDCLLTIKIDQLDQSIRVEVYDQELKTLRMDKFYRFRKPLFKKITDELFKI